MQDENLISSPAPQTAAPTVIQTDVGAQDGQNKCPRCGSTDISVNVNNGKLRCNFCRHEFEPEKVAGMVEDISQLEGEILGSGATDLVADVEEVVTFKCESCGAEVVVDTAESTQARCHWCRNTLSVNQQIPNGSIPDVVLPFGLKKAEARSLIEQFVNKRKFFAHPKFRQEFTTENIMGVYFPYMVVDVNGHSRLVGQGEHLVKKYTRGEGENRTTYYDADLYDVSREFDIAIEGLTIESSADKLNKADPTKTTNVINAIMPFDVENAVKWNANYLKGFSSEKRDTNIADLKPLAETQAKDVARFAANDSLAHYDRGVAWSDEQLAIKGQQWKAAYLPVWLYSYQQVNGNKKILHYVAVNARTKETMGSVPIHMPKLITTSALVELFGGFIALFVIDFKYEWLLYLTGFGFFAYIYAKYRNSDARHYHETETKSQLKNLQQTDQFVMHRQGLTNSVMEGANNKRVTAGGLKNGVDLVANSVKNGLKNSLK